jgi:hypothetical protein
MITESEPIARALDAAASFWPEAADNRTELLRKILAEGLNVVNSKAAEQSAGRLAAIEKLVSISRGMWPADFDQQRKSEWPE